MQDKHKSGPRIASHGSARSWAHRTRVFDDLPFKRRLWRGMSQAHSWNGAYIFVSYSSPEDTAVLPLFIWASTANTSVVSQWEFALHRHMCRIVPVPSRAVRCLRGHLIAMFPGTDSQSYSTVDLSIEHRDGERKHREECARCFLADHSKRQDHIKARAHKQSCANIPAPSSVSKHSNLDRLSRPIHLSER
jgi:hypothetical protein